MGSVWERRQAAVHQWLTNNTLPLAWHPFSLGAALKLYQASAP